MFVLPARTRKIMSWLALSGYDVDGGYAEYAVAPEEFAYELPDGFNDEHVSAAALRRLDRVSRPGTGGGAGK